MPVDRCLIDSSFLYAAFDTADANHAAAETFALEAARALIVPEVTLTEAAFLFRRSAGVKAVAGFLEAFATTMPRLAHIARIDLLRAREIMLIYPESRFDFVDCCLMALSERLGVTRVAAFDRRDFSIFRPAGCDDLQRLP